MSKTTAKPQPMVTVRIVPGPGTAYRRSLWAKFWQKLLAGVNAAEKQSPPSQAPVKRL